MDKNETFDLDEHAAFWARDDEPKTASSVRLAFRWEEQELGAWVRRFATPPKSRKKPYSLVVIEGYDARLIACELARNGDNIAEVFANCGAFRPFCPPILATSAARKPVLGARLNFDGSGAWFSRKIRANGDFSLEWEGDFQHSIFASAAQTLASSNDEFLARCLVQWQMPDSEMRRSWNFLVLAPEQRDDYVCQSQNASREELLTLTRALGHWLWNAVPEIGARALTLNLYWANPHIEAFDIAEFYRLRDYYQLWRVAILRAAAPRYLGHHGNPTHIENWLAKRAPLKLKIKPPTQHEKIEAHVVLRERISAHLSDAERRQLFDFEV